MVRHPGDMPAAFTAAFNSGDVRQLLALYGPDAVMYADGRTESKGEEAITAALNGFLALKGTIEMTLERAPSVGDIGLVVASWTITGQGPDGPVTLTGRTSDVVRRGADGGWTYLIDAPAGLAK